MLSAAGVCRASDAAVRECPLVRRCRFVESHNGVPPSYILVFQLRIRLKHRSSLFRILAWLSNVRHARRRERLHRRWSKSAVGRSLQVRHLPVKCSRARTMSLLLPRFSIVSRRAFCPPCPMHRAQPYRRALSAAHVAMQTCSAAPCPPSTVCRSSSVR